MDNEKDRDDLKSEKRRKRDLAEARKDKDANPDPITGAPGSHPIGTGIGSASAGTAGAAIGAMAGPAGAIAGAVVGAVVGGLIGHGVAEAIDPTVEHEYWRDNYRNRPYVDKEASYDEYAPAYQYGWESRVRFQDKTFEQAESEMERDWESRRGGCRLNWSEARNAVRDGWDRITARETNPESEF